MKLFSSIAAATVISASFIATTLSVSLVAQSVQAEGQPPVILSHIYADEFCKLIYIGFSRTDANSEAERLSARPNNPNVEVSQQEVTSALKRAEVMYPKTM